MLIEVDSPNSLAATVFSRKSDLSERDNDHSFTYLVFIEHIHFLGLNEGIDGFWLDDTDIIMEKYATFNGHAYAQY